MYHICLEEKIDSKKFGSDFQFIKEMDLNIALFQQKAFNSPRLINSSTHVLNAPPIDFDEKLIILSIGEKRMVEVLDIRTKVASTLTMKDWWQFFRQPKKDSLLQLQPVEFSKTLLDHYCSTPFVARRIDWTETAWPSAQVWEEYGDLNVYPPKLKYLLMPVKGCFSDFQIHQGGASAWYYMFKGSIIIWLVPPSERNLKLYESYTQTDGSNIFLGDVVETCSMLKMTSGQSLFVPSGWAVATYASEDSIMFNGIFLHSYAISQQLQIARLENEMRVPKDKRFPLYTETLWFVLEKYVWMLFGNNHLNVPEEKREPSSSSLSRLHLTWEERVGIKNIVLYLHGLEVTQKRIPDLICDPVALIKDVRNLIAIHYNDDERKAVTGFCVLSPITGSEPKEYSMLIKEKLKKRAGTAKGPQRRRTRCKQCVACNRDDCGQCLMCLDMVKYGGSGVKKQTCIERVCAQPKLPVTSTCFMCNLDGWGQHPMPGIKHSTDQPFTLMECTQCFNIAHPMCYHRTHPHTKGVVQVNFPSSWRCPDCLSKSVGVGNKRTRSLESRLKRISNAEGRFNDVHYEVNNSKVQVRPAPQITPSLNNLGSSK